MKKRLLFAVGVLLMVFAYTSCKQREEDDDVVVNVPGENQLLRLFHELRDSVNAVGLYTNQGHDFGLLMQAHHRATIKMANQQLEDGDNQAIRDIAQAMITRKQAEIVEIQKFIDGHTPTVSETGKTFDSESKTLLAKMYQDGDAQTLTSDSDHDFAALMVPHHQNVIAMAQLYLRLGNNVTLRAVAQKMVDDETAELKALQDWLAGPQN